MSARLKGVSLVELLIVVLIVGVMAFVAVPRMSSSIVSSGKVETTTKKISAAIRYTRSLAISNAATNTAGYSLQMTGPTAGYTGYKIVNLNDKKVLRTETIDSKAVCTGANDFNFGTLGNRTGDNDVLVVEADKKIFHVTVISATGMVKCVEK